jgi:hypothetical protein
MFHVKRPLVQEKKVRNKLSDSDDQMLAFSSVFELAGPTNWA